MSGTELVSTPRSVLGVFAHPDDADVACGGSLAKWKSEGACVSIVVCTKGEKGSIDKSISPVELAEMRTQEIARAQEILGVDEVFQLGYGDGEISNDDILRQRLVHILRTNRPDVVITPDPTSIFFADHYFNHRDHREVGWACLDSVFPAARLPHYFPDQGEPHEVETVLLSGTLEPDAYVDVSGFVGHKIKAVTSHLTQLQGKMAGVDAAVERIAHETGRQFGVRFAEAFRMVRSL